jgi:hypothetical protein
MTVERDDSLYTVVLLPLLAGAVGLILGLTIGPLFGGLGFVTGAGLTLVIGANVDSADSTAERIEELEARVEDLEAERDEE